MREASSRLEVRELSLAFAGLKALDKISFSVPAHSIFGLIGPNGAGKTTLLNCLTRIYTPDSGSLTFGSIELLAEPLHRMPEIGIARTFQNLELFAAESALDNVMIGVLSQIRIPTMVDLFGLPPARQRLREAGARALAALARLGIGDAAERQVATLAYGIQKRVELARALAAQPRLLLLDEPAAGLNAEESRSLAALLRDLRREGLTIILVEHDMALVMSVCDELVVLDHGEVIAQGSPSTIREDRKVIAAYLGEDDGDAA